MRKYPNHKPNRWRISESARTPSIWKQPSRLFSFFAPSNSDTPSASLYRLYQFFVIDWPIQFRNELEHFWQCTDSEWAVNALPDPKDPDPVRYAILAVLVQQMCMGFNRLIDLGLPRDAPAIVDDFDELRARPKIREVAPEWAKAVPPFEETIVIPNASGAAPSEDEMSQEFREMGIIVKAPEVYFV